MVPPARCAASALLADGLPPPVALRCSASCTPTWCPSSAPTSSAVRRWPCIFHILIFWWGGLAAVCGVRRMRSLQRPHCAEGRACEAGEGRRRPAAACRHSLPGPPEQPGPFMATVCPACAWPTLLVWPLPASQPCVRCSTASHAEPCLFCPACLHHRPETTARSQALWSAAERAAGASAAPTCCQSWC